MTTILDRLRTYARANSGQFQVCLSVAEIREIVRALEPAWQPIDSAPKDGTRILLWFSGGCDSAVCGQWNVVVGDDRRWEGWRREGEDIMEDWQHLFTHWMPLPSPPPPLSSPAEVAAFIDSMNGGTKRIENV